MNASWLRNAVCFIAMTFAIAASGEESRWEQTIQGFEAEDAENPPPEGAIVFYGSSSVRMWNTEEDFPEFGTINRGFGGSQTSDALEFVDRVVIPYKPRVVVFYEGDNDTAAGKSPDVIIADTMAFFERIHAALPDTRIAYIPIKPSIARWEMWPRMQQVNQWVERLAAEHDFVDYLDTATPMLGDDGEPRPELFVKDGLHLSREGYDVWNAVVRPYLERVLRRAESG